MPNDYFHFKQFTIHQGKCAMKVGTDSIVLGAWTSLSNTRKILDIGTGTGILSLMLAQRNPNATITAIELENNAASQAAENFLASPWQERLRLEAISLQEYTHHAKQESFDLIICNPPFFTPHLTTKETSRKIARQSEYLSQEDLLMAALKLLHQRGRIAVVFPIHEGKAFKEQMLGAGFYMYRELQFFSKETKKQKRVFMEFSKTENAAVQYESLIMYQEDNTWTTAFKNLTKDFYKSLL